MSRCHPLRSAECRSLISASIIEQFKQLTARGWSALLRVWLDVGGFGLLLFGLRLGLAGPGGDSGMVPVEI